MKKVIWIVLGRLVLQGADKSRKAHLRPCALVSVSSSLLVLQVSMLSIDPWKTKNGGQLIGCRFNQRAQAANNTNWRMTA